MADNGDLCSDYRLMDYLEYEQDDTEPKHWGNDTFIPVESILFD